MSLPSNLTAIRRKFRNVTGQLDSAQIGDPEIDQYINTFYVYQLPMHVPLFNMKQTYTFYTNALQDVYDFPRNEYSFIQPPAYCAGYQLFFSQSREQFYRSFPKLNFLQQVGNGDGLTTAFVFTLTNTPLLRASTNENNDILSDFLLSAVDNLGNSIQVIDNGTGGLVEQGTDSPTIGTINYATGAVTVDFALLAVPQTPGNGQVINAQYVPVAPSRPVSVLFFQDQFILRPVPDGIYKFVIDAWKMPFQFDTNTPLQVPQLNEWWLLIAYGAADLFFADNSDFENMQKYRMLLQEQLKLVNRRTIKQQTSQRSATIYSQQMGVQANNPWGMY